MARFSLVFAAGGLCYVLLELIWRGWSHASMFFVGGLCCCLLLKPARADDAPFWMRCLMGGAMITAIEFGAGCVLNLWLGLGVWDYSSVPPHLFGQVSLLYSVLWCALCAVVLPILRLADNKLRQIA